MIFVTGIGTDIGKTVGSAFLVRALKASYWKPVQAGGLDHSDADFVAKYGLTDGRTCFPESYRLNTPCSPHWAAEIDGVRAFNRAVTSDQNRGCR